MTTHGNETLNAIAAVAADGTAYIDNRDLPDGYEEGGAAMVAIVRLHDGTTRTVHIDSIHSEIAGGEYDTDPIDGYVTIVAEEVDGVFTPRVTFPVADIADTVEIR